MKRVVLVAVAVVFVGGLVFASYLRLRPEMCDGLYRDSAGCDPRARVFEGTDCLEVAAEWGRKVDQLLLQVIDSGREVSTRIFHYRSTISVSAGTQMGRHRSHLDCTVDEFLERAEVEFSEPFREVVGPAMWDYEMLVDWTEDDIGTYEDWFEQSRGVVEQLTFERAELIASGEVEP